MSRSPERELVSVLVPAFNGGDTIAVTLASARARSYGALEIIVVDDGSTNDTVVAVTEAAVDPRVTLIRQANEGVARARNAALAAASGRLIAPLDADDLWHADKIARQVKRIAAAGDDVGCVWCWPADIDRDSIVLERRLLLDRFEEDVFAPLIVDNSSATPAFR